MIPVSEPVLGEAEARNVADCVSTGWVSSAGQYIGRFEDAWSTVCQRRFGVAVANGTVALELAIAALKLPRGTEVIMPTFTIVSCALAVLRNGLQPVLVDADPLTYCMTPEGVSDAITDQTSAIMLVHIYGHPVDVGPILELADHHNLRVIEDAAEAHGAEYGFSHQTVSEDWRPCGSFGDVSTFSFYANKLVTTGEGGMVLTDDAEIARRSRQLSNLAFRPERRFVHEEEGYNFRLTNLQAALGVAQVERLHDVIDGKRKLAAHYDEALKGLPLQLPLERPWARSVYWMYAVVVDEDIRLQGEQVADRLRADGVDTRPFFVGMHEQPAFRDRGLFLGASFPVAERIARRGIYLPSTHTLSESAIARVGDSLRKALN